MTRKYETLFVTVGPVMFADFEESVGDTIDEYENKGYLTHSIKILAGNQQQLFTAFIVFRIYL